MRGEESGYRWLSSQMESILRPAPVDHFILIADGILIAEDICLIFFPLLYNSLKTVRVVIGMIAWQKLILHSFWIGLLQLDKKFLCNCHQKRCFQRNKAIIRDWFFLSSNFIVQISFYFSPSSHILLRG